LLRITFSSYVKTVTVFVLAAASIVGGIVGGQMMGMTQLGSSGLVKTIGVGVYWDSSCSQAVYSIDWGMVEPGSQKNTSVYIRNEGNTNITLSLATENWNPENASNYMTLTWDYDNRTLAPNQVIQVTLILSIQDDIEGIESFSFTIVIIGTG